MYMNKYRSFMRQKCDQDINRENSKMQRPDNRHTKHVECRNERDTKDGREQLEPCQRHSENNLINIPGKGDIKELRRTAVLSNAHIQREVLISTLKTFSMGNNITCNVNFEY